MSRTPRRARLVVLRSVLALSAIALAAGVLAGCGDDDGSAIALGVGAECTTNAQCGNDSGQACLTQFKGGYCGLTPCSRDLECPAGSACVTHDDGVNYCFLVCSDKPQCNVHRAAENEANCSSSAVFVEGAMGRKACIPPSSGT